MIKFLAIDNNQHFISLIKQVVLQYSNIKFYSMYSCNHIGSFSLKVKPDLILIDSEMVLEFGMEKLCKVKDCLPNTKFILMSSCQKENEKKLFKLLDFGFSSFLLKKDFKRTIKLLLDYFFRSSCITINEINSSENYVFTSTPVICIGGSAGSTSLIYDIVRNIDNFNAILIIVIHMPEMFTEVFARKLNSLAIVNVKEAKNSENIKKGNVYIVKGGKNMIVDKYGYFQIVDRLTPFTPSIDLLLMSISEYTKDNTISIILSGMGNDGVAGIKRVKENGGVSLVQSPRTAEYSYMPENIIKTGNVDLILEDDEIIKFINKLGG